MSEKAKSARFGVNQIIPVAAAGIAVLFIVLGLKSYGFWSPVKGPLPGFFPVIIAFGMLGASVLAFIFSFREEAPVWPKENWLAPLSVGAIIGATFLIGLVPSVGLYVILWLKVYEKCTWKTTLITFAVIMAIVVGCFVIWLGVPFPKGLIYAALTR